MNIIFGNFGNGTIALMQWVFECRLTNTWIISIDTQWAAQHWLARVTAAETYAEQCGFNWVRLSSPASFADIVRDRKGFPSQKFQWCAGFLKGLPLLHWLDEQDPACNAQILLGKSRNSSRRNFKLPEYIEQNEYYGNRKVWHPLYQHTAEETKALVERAGFDWLLHRSLECEPCIHSSVRDFQHMVQPDIEKLAALERELNTIMFEQPIKKQIATAKSHHFNDFDYRGIDMGCGDPYSCGD